MELEVNISKILCIKVLTCDIITSGFWTFLKQFFSFFDPIDPSIHPVCTRKFFRVNNSAIQFLGLWHEPKQRLCCSIIFHQGRGVFRDLSKIFDGAFLWKWLTAFSRSKFFQKSSIIGVWLSHDYTSARDDTLITIRYSCLAFCSEMFEIFGRCINGSNRCAWWPLLQRSLLDNSRIFHDIEGITRK